MTYSNPKGPPNRLSDSAAREFRSGTHSNPPTGTPPVNTVAPVVSGLAPVGSTLSTTDGTWTGLPAPTYTYQWTRDGANIGGATANTYVTVTADAGHAIGCNVTATNTTGSATASSNTIVDTIAPTNTVAPAVTGTFVIGGTLSSTTGTWTASPAPTFAYQWQRGGVDIGGATASTYTPVAADVTVNGVLQSVTCNVTATNGLGSATASSNARSFDPVTDLVLDDGYISDRGITNTAGRASAVASQGSGAHGLVFNIVAGATGPTINASNAACMGKQTLDFGGNDELIAAAAADWKFLHDGSPWTLLGVWTTPGAFEIVVSTALAASGAGIDLGPGQFSGQALELYISNDVGGQTIIAESPTIFAASAQQGAQVIVSTYRSGVDPDAVVRLNRAQIVTASDANPVYTGDPLSALTIGGVSAFEPYIGALCQVLFVKRILTANEIATYEQYALIYGLAPANTVTPTVSGSTSVGSVLAATPGTWTGVPVPTLTYQWKSGSGNATGSGATTASYTVAAADLGQDITCVVTATSTSGTTNATSSNKVHIVSLPYTADFTTQALGSGSVASYTNLSFARTSANGTVQTGVSTVVTGIGANTPRYGSDGTHTGLVNEETRTNLYINNRDASSATTFGTPTITANDENGPDGTLVADRVQASSSGGVFRGIITTNGSSYISSAWYKRKTGQGAGSFTLRAAGSSDVNASGTIQDNAWVRKSVVGVGAASTNVLPVDGRPLTAALDNEVDLVQHELGKFATEAIITAGAGVARGTDQLSHTIGGALIDLGRIGMEVKIQPKGSSSQYSSDMRLWHLNSNNHAEIVASTAALKITIGGVAYTTPVALTWAAGDTLEIWHEAGGGSLATYASYRVNGGAKTVLSTGSPPTAAAITVFTAIGLLSASGAVNAFSAWIKNINFYANGSKPAWA